MKTLYSSPYISPWKVCTDVTEFIFIMHYATFLEMISADIPDSYSTGRNLFSSMQVQIHTDVGGCTNANRNELSGLVWDVMPCQLVNSVRHF